MKQIPYLKVFLFYFVSLFVSLFVCLFLCLSLCLYIFLFLFLNVFLSYVCFVLSSLYIKIILTINKKERIHMVKEISLNLPVMAFNMT